MACANNRMAFGRFEQDYEYEMSSSLMQAMQQRGGDD
jgi:hypothetical protein